jgi:hypothetical protein
MEGRGTDFIGKQHTKTLNSIGTDMKEREGRGLKRIVLASKTRL